MRQFFFAWPETAMPRCFMLVLILCLGISGGCQGQVPTPSGAQGSDSTRVVDKPTPLPIPTDGVNPYKGKPWIGIDNDKGKIFSYASDGSTLDVDWEKLLYDSKFLKFTLPDAQIIGQNEINIDFIYRIGGNYDNLKSQFESIGIRLPMNFLKKSKTLHYNYHYTYYGSYMASNLSVQLFDYIDEKEYEITPIFRINKVEVYNHLGKRLAHIESELPLAPNVILSVSDDEQYVLLGTAYPMGEGASSEDGEFVLYDRKSRRNIIIPKIEEESKYADDIGHIDHTVFSDSLFQIIYYDGTEGLRFMIDPYKRLLYYRYYPRPTLLEIYRGIQDVTMPTLPDGSIKDISQYEIKSF